MWEAPWGPVGSKLPEGTPKLGPHDHVQLRDLGKVNQLSKPPDFAKGVRRGSPCLQAVAMG